MQQHLQVVCAVLGSQQDLVRVEVEARRQLHVDRSWDWETAVETVGSALIGADPFLGGFDELDRFFLLNTDEVVLLYKNTI